MPITFLNIFEESVEENMFGGLGFYFEVSNLNKQHGLPYLKPASRERTGTGRRRCTLFAQTNPSVFVQTKSWTSSKMISTNFSSSVK